MRRRTFLSSTAVGSLTALAGCSSIAGGPTTDTPTPQFPDISYSEERIDGGTFALKVTVQLHDFTELRFEDPSERTVDTVTESGRHKIAGKNTRYGPIAEDTRIEGFTGGNEIPITTWRVGQATTPGSGPTFLDGIQRKTVPEKTDETVELKLTHEYGGQSYAFTTDLPKTVYDYYTDRIRVPEYGMYISDLYDERAMDNLVAGISRSGADNNLGPVELAEEIAAAVQSLEYIEEDPTNKYNEYPKFPAETLVDEGGDCEDTAILLAGLFHRAGIGVRLLKMIDKRHMALGVQGDDEVDGTYYEQDGEKFYYLETTGEGYEVGEIPDSMRGAEPELVEVSDQPVLNFGYKLSVVAGEVILPFEVVNSGSAPATTGTARVEFETKSDGVIAAEEKELPEIAPGDSREVTLGPDFDTDRPVRVSTAVFLDGDVHVLDRTGYKEP